MKRLLLPMLAALALPTAVEANLFQKDDLIATASASNKIIKFKF